MQSHPQPKATRHHESLISSERLSIRSTRDVYCQPISGNRSLRQERCGRNLLLPGIPGL